MSGESTINNVQDTTMWCRALGVAALAALAALVTLGRVGESHAHEPQLAPARRRVWTALAQAQLANAIDAAQAAKSDAEANRARDFFFVTARGVSLRAQWRGRADKGVVLLMHGCAKSSCRTASVFAVG